MKFLVTGGSGFLGNGLVRYLLNGGYKVRAVGRPGYAFHPNCWKGLQDNTDFEGIKGNLLDGILTSELVSGVDGIFHLAAESHVDRSFSDPQLFFEANTIGTVRVLEAARRNNPEIPIVHYSTDEVFGSVPYGSLARKEEDKLKPVNPYACSKAAAEMAIRTYNLVYKMDVRVIRSFNAIGPFQAPEKLVPKIITSAISDKPFTLYNGETERGWIYSDDVSRAALKVMLDGGRSETYNLGCFRKATVSEVKDEILSIIGKPKLFLGYKGTRLQDDERYDLDWNKIRKLGWEPKVNFRDIFYRTLVWFDENRWWWEWIKE